MFFSAVPFKFKFLCIIKTSRKIKERFSHHKSLSLSAIGFLELGMTMGIYRWSGDCSGYVAIAMVIA